MVAAGSSGSEEPNKEFTTKHTKGTKSEFLISFYHDFVFFVVNNFLRVLNLLI